MCEARGVTSIQVADQGFIAVPPEMVAPLIADRASWRRWWPDLALTVREDRGPKGVRWTIAGPLTGTMEIWLTPSLDGTMLHYFMHAEPTAAASSGTDLLAMNRAWREAGKRMNFEVKAILEAGRAPGEPPAHVRASASAEG